MDTKILRDAISKSWCLGTGDEPDAWDAVDNPQRGQCGATALVVHDYLGGNMLISEVTVDGERVGVHYSNQLPNGELLDFTADQFREDEVLGVTEPVVRTPHQPPRFGIERYNLLSRLVQGQLNNQR